MPQNLYTPFMTEGTRNMGNAFMQYSQNKRQGQQQAMMQDLTKRAYMGDQQAMAELTGINPQMAMQIQQSQRNVRQDKLSTDALQIKEQDRQRDISTENQDILSGILQEAAKLPTFEEAQAYAARETEARSDVLGQLPPLSEEAYNQVRQIQAEQPEQVSAIDQARINKLKAETDKIKKGEKKKIKLNDAQAKASGFYERMVGSQREIDRVFKESPAFEAESWTETAPAAISNMFATVEYQQYKQAADDWIRAKLRRESGAVIAIEEMEKEYSTYFPVFGDTKKVIAQKKRARKTAEKGMLTSAGGEAVIEAPKIDGKTEVRRGTFNGRTVIEYADGSVEYAD